MSLLIWSLVFLLAGLVAYLAGGILISPLLSDTRRQQLADWYWKQAAVVADHLSLINREVGGVDLEPSEFDPDRGTEITRVDGERRDFGDDAKRMKRLYGRPFGVANEERDVYVSPIDSEIAGVYSDMVSDNRDVTRLEIDGSEEKWFTPHVPISSGLEFADLSDGIRVTAGSAHSRVSELAYSFAEKSQKAFNTTRIAQHGLLLMSAGLGFGLVWFAWSQGSSGGGSSVSVGLGLISSGLGGWLV